MAHAIRSCPICGCGIELVDGGFADHLTSRGTGYGDKETNEPELCPGSRSERRPIPEGATSLRTSVEAEDLIEAERIVGMLTDEMDGRTGLPADLELKAYRTAMDWLLRRAQRATAVRDSDHPDDPKSARVH